MKDDAILSGKTVYILFDCPDDHNDKSWMIDEIRQLYRGGVFSVSIGKVLSRLSRDGLKGKLQSLWIMLTQCVRALRASKRDDVIICWRYEPISYAGWKQKKPCPYELADTAEF